MDVGGLGGGCFRPFVTCVWPWGMARLCPSVSRSQSSGSAGGLFSKKYVKKKKTEDLEISQKAGAGKAQAKARRRETGTEGERKIGNGEAQSAGRRYGPLIKSTRHTGKSPARASEMCRVRAKPAATESPNGYDRRPQTYPADYPPTHPAWPKRQQRVKGYSAGLVIPLRPRHSPHSLDSPDPKEYGISLPPPADLPDPEG